MKDSEKYELRFREMGFIFQSYELLPHFNTRENVALSADLAGELTEGIRRRIEDLLNGEERNQRYLLMRQEHFCRE
jgi:putative ABC transport system ATP-binding protein